MPLTPPGDGFNHLSKTDGSGDVKFKYAPVMSEEVAAQGAFIHFDGRAYPLVYAGERTEDQWILDFLVNKTKDGTEQWDALRNLFDTNRGSVFIWQDHLGNAVYVSLLTAKRDLVPPHPLARVKFTLVRVDPPV